MVRFAGNFRQRLIAVLIMLASFFLIMLLLAWLLPTMDKQVRAMLTFVIGFPISVVLASAVVARWFGNPKPLPNPAMIRALAGSGTGTPLASKIILIGALLGIAAAVFGSFVAPRQDQIYFAAAAVLIPALFIFGARLFRR